MMNMGHINVYKSHHTPTGGLWLITTSPYPHRWIVIDNYFTIPPPVDSEIDYHFTIPPPVDCDW